MRSEILIVSNAPGELASWVHPVIRRLREIAPAIQVTVALVPCPYASGNEANVIAAWDEPTTVWTPPDTLRFIATGQSPTSAQASQRGAVLFLGGDQVFAALLSARTGYPLLVYTDRQARWKSFVTRYLISDRNLLLGLRNRRHPAEQLRLVGNLMVDAVTTRYDAIQARRSLEILPNARVLGLLPGSKPFKVKHVTPLFLRVAQLLKQRNPDLQVVLHRSPFTSREQLVDAVENPIYRSTTGGIGGRMERVGTQDWIHTSGGMSVLVVPPDVQYEGMAIADVALTLPGTNTAELAILGVPMVVALPLHRPEQIPLDGLVGRIGDLPVLGPALKRFLARRIERHPPLLALPNQRAGFKLVPEVVGRFSPEQLAAEVERSLSDDVGLRETRMRLREVMGAPGAANEIIDELMTALGESPPVTGPSFTV